MQNGRAQENGDKGMGIGKTEDGKWGSGETGSRSF